MEIEENNPCVSENGVCVRTGNTVLTPKKNEVIFNPEMIISRSLALLSLGTYIRNGWCLNKTVRCLDALGATGIAGLSWAKNFPQVEVTINDSLETSCRAIKENELVNNVSVEVTQQDVNILLLQRPFDFIFLDCYGSSVHYLESLFKNVPKNGLLVITSTDDAALYGKVPDVTLRNYGGYIVKTFYSKELAARLIIAAVARSSARCNKGIEVLGSFAVKSHITLILKVTRGPAAATQCVNKIRKLLHCCICEDKVFFPQSIYPVENPYSLLSCNCRTKSSGHVGIELGPIWSGPIFDPDFCLKMLEIAEKEQRSPKVISLLQTVVTESLGGTWPTSEKESFLIRKLPESTFTSSDKSEKGVESQEDVSDLASKKKKLELCSPFYFNLHRHSPKGYDLGKINKIVKFLQSRGHRASRTHFDPEAIRTSASLKELTELLMVFSQGSSLNI
ncbi:TRMT1-like protein [Armadillidium nasatum]|uniref:tRNA (guanine(26)-N(2))-dimethyltransferase n=1 Tax=Armadillidium nasatum TaxID=96803 RepID=A0A5N5SYT9_9CRUS|nr:TRMT1-like protein [Armadillidium nasatum]